MGSIDLGMQKCIARFHFRLSQVSCHVPVVTKRHHFINVEFHFKPELYNWLKLRVEDPHMSTTSKF